MVDRIHDYVSLREICRLLHVGPTTARRLIDEGHFGSHVLPGQKHPKYLRADVERLAAAHRPAAPVAASA